MAEKTFRCKLITPEAKVLDEAVKSAVIPVWDGLMGIRPGRAPIVAKLGIGELRLDFPDDGKAAGGSRSYLVEDGFANMVDGELTILAAKATPAERLTESEVQAEATAAQQRAVEGLSGAEAQKAREARLRAQTKLRLARTFKSRGI